MTRFTIPLYVVAGAAIAMTVPGSGSREPGVCAGGTDVRLVPTESLRIVAMPGSVPAQMVLSGVFGTPRVGAVELPAPEDVSVRGTVDGSVVAQMPAPAASRPAVRDNEDGLKSALGDPEDDNPFASLAAKEMSPDSGWGWLADDVRQVQKAAARGRQTERSGDDVDMALPGSTPDDRWDMDSRGRGRRLQLE